MPGVSPTSVSSNVDTPPSAISLINRLTVISGAVALPAYATISKSSTPIEAEPVRCSKTTLVRFVKFAAFAGVNVAYAKLVPSPVSVKFSAPASLPLGFIFHVCDSPSGSRKTMELRLNGSSKPSPSTS